MPDKEEVQGEDEMGKGENSNNRGGEDGETEVMYCRVYVTFIGNASGLRCCYTYSAG